MAKADALVAETPLAAAKPFGEDGSIKNNKLFKTNPISKKPKMKLNHYTTKLTFALFRRLTLRTNKQKHTNLPINFLEITRKEGWYGYHNYCIDMDG
ncbi:MAG: hypothetical protein NTX52_15660, partial [Planctomycetota bacterium]|nr:hypothetical protein [Planctomycetota bacterium]